MAAASDVQLKYLSFVKILAINAAVVASNLYAYAKHNSGPFKSTLRKLENAVTPFYSKFNQLPTHILLFLDDKVDEATYVFDKHAPPAAKSVISKGRSMVKKASYVVQEAKVEAESVISKGRLMVMKASDLVQEAKVEAKSVISKGRSMVMKASDLVQEAKVEAKRVISKGRSVVKKASDLVQEAKVDGPVAAISHAGKISKEFTVSQLVGAWYKANQYSFVHGVLKVAIPTATHLSEKYNSLVKDVKAKEWCSLFNYVPLVPLEEMKKAYKQVQLGAAALHTSGSDSNKE